MPQTQQLFETLKHALKAHKRTYADVAGVLQLSEASVKRLFAEKKLSLLRLEQVCQMLNRWTLVEMLNYFRITEFEAIRCLARLDRLKIIDLLPGNRIKLRVSANFDWLENGPIQQLFRSRLQDDFFDSRFDRQTERLLVVNGMLSRRSNEILQRKMERLAREFDELNDDDAHLALDQRHGVTMVIAMSDWRFGLFADLRR